MSESLFDIPVLICVFNRPDTTKEVLKVVETIKPKDLYIAADAPRINNLSDVEKCESVRKICEAINWDCNVKRLYQTKNLGCKNGPIAAFNWFFNNVEMGIVLEDDCVPDLSFFNFCRELLIKFKDDKRIMMISGYNHEGEWKNNEYSYHFAFYGSIWGWASWRRAWEMNNVTLANWDEIKRENILNQVLCQDNRLIKYRESLIDYAIQNNIDAWDYQWGVNRIINSGLSIIPTVNLIKNVGFGVEATHTFNELTKFKFNCYNCEFPLRHNPYIVPDRAYDNSFMKKLLPENSFMNKTRMYLSSIIKKLR